jgi:hypothetical protein
MKNNPKTINAKIKFILIESIIVSIYESKIVLMYSSELSPGQL